MGRWKAIIGPKLKARCFENQQTEAKIGVAILNKSFNLNDLVPHDEITECGTYEFTDIDDWRLDEMIKSAVAFIRSQPGHPT